MMKVHISTFYHNICQDQFFYYLTQTYSKLILITAGVQSSVPDTKMFSVMASGTSSLAAEVVFHVQHPDLDPQMKDVGMLFNSCWSPPSLTSTPRPTLPPPLHLVSSGVRRSLTTDLDKMIEMLPGTGDGNVGLGSPVYMIKVDILTFYYLS